MAEIEADGDVIDNEKNDALPEKIEDQDLIENTTMEINEEAIVEGKETLTEENEEIDGSATEEKVSPVSEEKENITEEARSTMSELLPVERLINKPKIPNDWSENYEGIDDNTTLEDVSGDPKKEILWAAENNELEILRKLLEEDPNLCHSTDSDQYTPLHRACYSNHVEVIKVLLSYDADISAKTIDGWTPLHCACKWDSVEAASLLLQNGADVNAVTNGHLTPLHLAASNQSGRRTLELLLWHPYIDPSIKNDANDLPYDCAYRSGPLSTLFEILDDSINIY